MTPTGEVTRLLASISSGDERAEQRLLEVAYEELRRTAAGLMARERPDHTLQPTALVHEAAARLIGDGVFDRIENRGHFFAVMAVAMRRVLVDHARSRRAERRGGGRQRIPLDAAVELVESGNRLDLVALDEALDRLKELSGRQCRIVEMRFFGGFEMAEIAEHMGVSLSTVEKDWRVARAWLRGQLQSTE